MNGMPKENRLWCISCGHVVKVELNTTVMKTAYKLTPTGPVPYGICGKCNSATQPRQS